MGTTSLLLLVCGAFVVGGLLAFLLTRGRRRPLTEETDVRVETIAERVRAVGKLVGLEVSAKEIATATKGWGWLPPLVLSQARLAMIFTFEKQYAVDLARLDARDVEQVGERQFRLTLPPIRGDLRLTDVTPYDIQDGRVLGLLDVVQMNAARQGDVMACAREQASSLYAENDARYLSEARAAVIRQMETLLALFDVEVEVRFAREPREGPEPETQREPKQEELKPQPSAIAVAS